MLLFAMGKSGYLKKLLDGDAVPARKEKWALTSHYEVRQWMRKRF
jgi:hypothetical protein